MAVIDSIDQLRAVIGEEIPGIRDKNIGYLDNFAIAFIAESPFLIMSTADENGRCDGSPKGDEPGFVHVVDSRTLLVPDRPGNKLAYGHQNILANPQVSLLFCIPGTSETLRVNGVAELNSDPEDLEKFAARDKPAVLILKVTVEECFFHCGKAFIRSGLWKQASWMQTPHRVSFGKIYQQRSDTPDEVVRVIDESVELDYKNNL